MHAEQTRLLEMEGLTRHYRMGDNVVRALDGVDLTIGAGEFVTIVGSSGSGKSTLMHLLGCLDTATSGLHRIGGEDATTCTDGQLSALRNRRIGFVFQQFNLLSDLTVLENIALPLAYAGTPKKERLERAEKLAQRMGLGDRTDHKPSELSGGQAQRVAIARALINDPDILLADEPTGNLDSVTGQEIMGLLHELNEKGLTVIMVTHDPVLAESGSRKVVMRDGKVLEDKSLRPASAQAGPVEMGPPPESPGLSLSDLARIGLVEGLLCHKTRSALTMLGIIIGVAAVIAMTSFSLGSKKKQADQIRALGANLMRVVDKNLEGKALTDARKRGSQGLSLNDMDSLAAHVRGVKRAAAVRKLKINVLYGRRPLSPQVLGVTGDYLKVNNLSLQEGGRMLNAGDQARSTRVAVLGAGLARRLDTQDPVGETLLLGGDPYTIIGVLEDKNVDTRELEASSMIDTNQLLLIPLQTLLQRTYFLEMRNELDEIQLQLENEDALYFAGAEVKRQLLMGHDGVEDFQIVIPLNLLKQKQQAQKLLDVLTLLIASISLLVGGIGIMNIMLAAVTERIREIGIRRAVGATQRDICTQFLSESIIISLTGGLAGVVLALGATFVACFFLAIPFVVSALSLLISVVASTTVGLVFGLYPAVQAARKDPVEALRYE